MSAPTVYLETFGCQMNELDSELVRGQLTALGYRFTDDDRAADVVLYNTCSVREQAENKAYSRIGIIGKRKKEGERVVLGVLGCMAERDGLDMIRRHPQIDLLCGPGELDRLPQLIDNAVRTSAAAAAENRAFVAGPARKGFAEGRANGPSASAAPSLAGRDMTGVVALQGNRSRRSTTLAAAEDSLELLDLSRAFDPDRAPAGGKAAYVRITRGCNKFCTYCVVPNTRGAEVHRPPDHIVEECRKLAEQGVVEVTLLGQTVNHYIYVHGPAMTVGGGSSTGSSVGASVGALVGGAMGGNAAGLVEAAQVGPGLAAFRGGLKLAAGQRVTTFADLLRRIHDEIPALRRLRFVTSYPRDFGDDVLAAIAESPRICRYLHVPPQSGSDRVLRLMNRGYTVGEYLDFIDRVNAALPDAGISGDFIVGFPSETDEDFAATVALLERVRFKNSFIFKYSPRPGTAAIDRFEDDVPDDVKRWRNNELLKVQARVGAEVHRGWIGRTVDVFVEQVGTGGAAARSTSGHAVAVPAGGGQVGDVAVDARQPRAVPGAGVELRWSGQSRPGAGVAHRESSASESRVQLTGRSGADLIVALQLPLGEAPESWLGRIVPVRITNAGPLLLTGEIVH